VDVHRKRVGYSSQGPGRLSAQKPDVAGYTHFAGSGVYPEDSGTSAACPVVAGVVAAVRTAHPATELAPSQLRALLARTARDVGGHGFDFDTGWGIVEPVAIARALGGPAPLKPARPVARARKRRKAARPGARRRG
jgi:subtilisin family serine protease